MKSIELFLALSVAASSGISAAEPAKATQSFVPTEEIKTFIIAEGGEDATQEDDEGLLDKLPVEGGEGS